MGSGTGSGTGGSSGTGSGYDRMGGPGAGMGSAAAATPPPRIDPLALDLNGDGITTTSVNRFGAHFDMDGNGFAESVGWVSSDDGILVRDLSGGARIGAGYLGSRGICSHMPTSVSNSPVSGM